MERLIKYLLILFGGLFVSVQAMAQKVETTIRFNSTTSEYEVYGKPDFSAAVFNVGGGTQITVVLPKSIADAKLTITSVNGGVWADNSTVYAPTAAPNSDFHGISTTGAPMSWTTGQEKMLFKFSLTGNCVAGVRLFENTSDPQSDAPGMLFGDYNNYIGNAINFADVYKSNYDNTGTTCSVNLPPIATNDIAETPQDKPFTGNVLTNDDDPEGGPLTVTTTPVTPPTKGTVSLNPDGTFTYTPNPGVTGQDGFCYEVKDNVGLKDTACVVINIIPTPTPGNDKPIAVDDNTQTEVGTPVTINAKANDSDPDGNATLGTPAKLTDPTNGTVSQNPDGTFVYTPNANFTGTDKFTYRICDNGTPSLCDTATVSINVVPVIAGNNPPVAVDDANVTTKNTPVSGTVAANDSDVDNTAAQLTYTKVTNPTNGTVVQNADGTYTYTPNTNYVGSDHYTYKVCDPSGACDTATVVIAILPPANNPPIATNDIGETPQDKPFTGNVLTNDDDPEGGPLTVTTTPVTPPTKGTVSLNPDGTFTYTPNPGVTGQDGFCYEVKDNVGLKDTACVVINIIPTPTPGNDKPIAVDDNTQTEVGTPVTINAKANDSDPDGNATLGTPAKLTNPTNGTVSQNPDGTFVYTPNANFTGTDKFTYRICDNGTPSLCDTATVSINVVPVIAGNNPPVAVDDANVTTRNTPVSGTVAANDSDVDNTAAQLTYTKVTNPTNGTVVQNADGTYTYTPTTGFVGSDHYTYKVCDPSGACDTATVVIAILPPANNPPIATNDISETPQDKPFTGNVLTNDDDPEGGPLTVTTTPVTPPTKGTVSLNPDGTFTYTPNPGVTGQDGFCYEVKDNVGLKDTACVVINIIPTPTPGNDKPIAVDDNTQTEVGTPVTINAKANDSDPDGNATLGTPAKLTDPTNGTVSQNPDGTFVYTPNANFTGTDKFTYRICDNGTPSLCDTATVSINVVPVIAGNNPPVAVDDANVTTKNTPVSGTVAANDSDPDNTAAQLTYTKVTNPTNGTVVQNADGTYTYTPTTGFVGSDRYTYKVCDPSGACDTATVVIAILPPANNPPIATNDISETPQDKPFTGNVLTNDDDPEGGPLTVTTTPVTPPTKGTVSLNPDGTFTYTPNPGVTGQDGFCYELKDNVGLKDTACVVINIIPTPTPGNDKPIAVDDNTQTEVGTPVTINAKANDSDPDGNATLGTPVKLTNPTNGTVTQNPDGTFVYTPNANFTGTDKFTYRICDNGTPSLCDTATVSINVVPVIAGNNPPVAVDDANVTTKNTPVSGTVAANDSDVDNTAAQLTYTKVSNPTNGTVVQNADGTYTYTPTTGFVGSDHYTYKVCDPSGACDTATVVIAILPPANNPPIATNDIAETPQDKPFTGNVLTNDDDPEGGPLTVTTTPVTPPTKGTVSLNPDGTFTYTPNPGVTGQDGFCYEVKDNVGLKDTACVVINIIPTPTPGNDKPIAVDDNTQTEVGTPVTINAKANDSDPDGNATLGTPVKLTNPTNGTVTQNPDGTFVYTPNANFTGTDKFTYRICDSGTPSLCDTATVTINVVPVIAGNNPPVAVDDANVTTKNTSVSGTVAANDSDVDNTAAQLTYTKVTNPTNGTVVQNADGTYTYTPTTGFVGSDRYTYKVCDPSGACDTATVVIAILPPANNPPIATNDIGETPQDKPFTGNVLTNDDDPEGGPLTVTTTPVTPPTKGTVSLNPDGTFTYTPNPGVTGQDGFCYEVKDNVGLKDTACVVINIIPTPTPGNDKPIAVDDNTQTEVGTPVTINAKANDSDPDGNATLGTPVKLTNPTNGTVTQNPDGTFVYTPNANFTGTDKFTYRICDNGSPSLCDTATVSINVVPVIAGNNPPVAVDDANVTTKNTPVSGTVAANDSDVDNTAAQLTYTKVTNPTNGTVVQNADGTYTYTPTTGFVGSDRYTYKVCDPSGACDTATVVIAILPPANNPPIATNDIGETPQDKPFTGNVLTNDDDPEGGPLTVTTTPVTPPTKGTVSLNPDGTFTYTPNPGVTGQDGFCYEVKDNVGLKDTACVVINIIPTPTPGNDKPIAVDDNTQTEVGTPVTINAKANDSDPDASGTPNGTLGTPAKLTNPTNGTVTQNPDGTFVYTPNANFTGTDKFTYRICDNGTPSLCDTATVSINVVPVIAGNNPPVAVDDANVTTRNTPVSGTVAANDSDVDNTAAQLTYTKVTNPTNGTVVQNADGTYTYTPTTGFVGSDRYTYKVCDPSGACDTATVVIAILPPANNPPIATNDIGETPQDKPFTGNVLTNDDDPEGGPLTVTTTPVTPPTKGTVSLNPDGTFTYTPNPGVTGQDGFCYELKDNVGLKDTACVVINIIPTPTPGNDKPIAVDDNTQTEVGTPVTINAKANDSDPDGNATLGTPAKLTNPTNGTVTQNPDGTFVYTPNANFTGTDKFTYRICDNGTPSLCDTATVTINVVPVIAGNNPPVAVDDANVTTRNTPVSGTVAANDSDVDNTAAQLTYTKVTNPTNGTVVQNADGTYTYTPNTNYVGSDHYTYKVCDPSGACDTATVVIAILPPANNPPIATNDIAETPQDKPFTGNVLTNDDDPEGGPLTVTTTPVTPPTKGTVSLNPDGTFTYTPNPGVTGQDGFCYEVKDNVGLKDTACVVINIIPTPTPGNDKPIAVDDNTQTEVGTPVTINAKANDSDPDGNATLGTPAKLTNPTNGTVTQNPDGTFVYTPNANFTGTDKFTYRICDNGSPSLCDTATVTINVVPVIAGNNPPVAVDDANVTTRNTPVPGTVASNDSDVDNTAAQLTYAKVTNPTNGTVVQNADGTYTYTPNTNFVGSDRYTYKVCDPSGACDTATVVIAILPPANNPPIATNDIGETPQDKPFTGNVLTNDDDPEGGPLTVTTTPVTPPTKGTVSLNPDGTFTYTPNPGVTGQDGFCYEVKDNVGLKDTACVVINIIPTPTPGNDKPIAVDDNTQTEVGTPVTINAKANDSDPDGNATLGTPAKLTNPTNGTVTQNPDGTFVYTPNANFTGTDKFTYRICDNGTPSLCDTATVSINVVPVIAGNNPPVAVDDANVTTKNTPVSGTVAANDSDVDNTAAQLTYTKVTNPTNGTVVQNADGTYTYTPTTGFVGSDHYTYKVCDPSGACDTATVVIAILPPANQPPIGINDIAITPQDSPVTGNVLVNDDDPEGGPLTVTTTPVTPPTKGTVSLNPDGTFTYTPNPGVTGQDGFCYELKDNAGLKDTACVVINIIPNPKPTNDKPVAIDDNTQTYQNAAVVIPVKFNDTDPDAAGMPNGTLGTPVKLTNPTHGTVIANADGTFTYTPTTGFVGSDSFTYQICDNGTPSLCDTATVTINVLAPPPAGNRPPVVVDDAIITSVNTPKSGDVSRNDYDPDAGQTLTFSKQTNPSHGTVVFNADGTYTYTPTTGYVGSDIFTYKVCDSGSPQLCTLGTVIIAVLPPANKVCLQAKVYLQGALFGVLLPDTLMRDDLRVKGYLPTTSPYPAMGMTGLTTANTSTLAVVGASSPSGKDAIVDWVFIELRSKTSPTTVVDSRSALLQRDGDIVDVDGVSTITFNSASPDSYYVVVKHRNHLGVMSKTPVDMTNTCGVIDFRKTTTPTYNLDETNVVNKAQVDVLQGVALWAGNSLFDNQVIYQGTDNDVNVIYQQVINYVGNVFVSKFYTLKGYYTGDINLNGDAIFQGTGNDVEYIYQNIIKNHPGNTLGQKFFIIKEQIP